MSSKRLEPLMAVNASQRGRGLGGMCEDTMTRRVGQKANLVIREQRDVRTGVAK